jgi:hypothetical protein
MVEEKYKELTRNYETANQIYNELLKKTVGFVHRERSRT